MIAGLLERLASGPDHSKLMQQGLKNASMLVVPSVDFPQRPHVVRKCWKGAYRMFVRTALVQGWIAQPSLVYALIASSGQR